MTMRRLSKRETIGAIVAAVVVAGAIAYGYVLEPAMLAFRAAHERAADAQRDLLKLHALAEHQGTIEADYARLQSGITSASNPQELAIALLNEVSELVRGTGLELVGLQPLKVVPGAEFTRFGVELQVQGEAHELVKLLQQAQEERHLLRSENIAIRVQQREAPIAATVRFTKLAQLRETS